MSVRAKFQCNISENGGVALHPVVASTNNAENTAFFQATPTGSISMGGLTAEVQQKFSVGAEYYIDFTPAV